MGLEIKFSVSEDPGANTITLKDTTGIYNATSNPTGYYGINPSTGQVTSMTVRVRRPDPTTLQVSTDAAYETTIDLIATFPSVNGATYTITPADLGLGADDTFIDGAYEFKFIASRTASVAFSSTYKTTKIFYANLCCCEMQAVAKTDLDDCGCAPCRQKILDTAILTMAVKSVIANNNCGKPNKALDSLKIGQSICNKEGCSGCN